MTERERFLAAAEKAAEELDEPSLRICALVIEAHLLYKSHYGYTAAEMRLIEEAGQSKEQP